MYRIPCASTSQIVSPSTPSSVAIVLTTLERVPALEARLRELHPYELPEFLVIPATGGSEAYLAWVAEAVRAG